MRKPPRKVPGTCAMVGGAEGLEVFDAAGFGDTVADVGH